MEEILTRLEGEVKECRAQLDRESRRLQKIRKDMRIHAPHECFEKKEAERHTNWLRATNRRLLLLRKYHLNPRYQWMLQNIKYYNF